MTYEEKYCILRLAIIVAIAYIRSEGVTTAVAYLERVMRKLED